MHSPTVPGWRNYPVLSLQLELTMLDGYRLPPFAGSLFRGCLGWALQQYCTADEYAMLFETRNDQADLARPFVLVPPVDCRDLKPGDRLKVSLRLLGNGCGHAHQFLMAFRQIGRVGLGESRSKFELTRVLVDEGTRSWVCYDAGLAPAHQYLPLPCALGNFAFGTWTDVSEIELDFVTPTRIVHKGEPVRQPDFHVVVRTLLRRMEGLLAQQGVALDFDYRAEVERALGVETVAMRASWTDWERKSNRQRRNITMGGLVGAVRYRGDFQSEVLGLLQAAQIVHVGKATTFGMGAFSVRALPRQLVLPAPPAVVRKTTEEALGFVTSSPCVGEDSHRRREQNLSKGALGATI